MTADPIIAKILRAFPGSTHVELDLASPGRVLPVSFDPKMGRLPELMVVESGAVVGRRSGIKVVPSVKFGLGMQCLWGQGVVLDHHAYFVMPTHDEILARGPVFKAGMVVGYCEALLVAQKSPANFFRYTLLGCCVCGRRNVTAQSNPSIGWCADHRPEVTAGKRVKTVAKKRGTGKRRGYDEPML